MAAINPTPEERTSGFQGFEDRGKEDEVGGRGEEIFEEFLKEHNIPFYWALLPGTYQDQPFDFKVGELTIDVKTRLRRSYVDSMLLPVDKDPDCDLYVSVVVWEGLNSGKIMGFLCDFEISGMDVGSFGDRRARYCEFSDLHPKEELEEILIEEVMEGSN